MVAATIRHHKMGIVNLSGSLWLRYSRETNDSEHGGKNQRQGEGT